MRKRIEKRIERKECWRKDKKPGVVRRKRVRKRRVKIGFSPCAAAEDSPQPSTWTGEAEIPVCRGKGKGPIPYNNFRARLTLCSFCSLLVAGTRRFAEGRREAEERVDEEVNVNRVPEHLDCDRLYPSDSFCFSSTLSMCPVFLRVSTSISRTNRTPSRKSVFEQTGINVMLIMNKELIYVSYMIFK